MRNFGYGLSILTQLPLASRGPNPADLAPRWVQVVTGRDLLQNSMWDANTIFTDPAYTNPILVVNGNLVFTNTSATNFTGGVNLLSPSFQVADQFGDSTQLITNTGTAGMVGFRGSQKTGARFYQGATRVEQGIRGNNQVQSRVWDGVASSPTCKVLGGPQPTGPIAREVTSVGATFTTSSRKRGRVCVGNRWINVK
jgi:hypothetical protein